MGPRGPTVDGVELDRYEGPHDLRTRHCALDGWAWLSFGLANAEKP